MSPENSRDWKTFEKDPKITTTGAGSEHEEEADSSSDYESSADEKEGIPAPTMSTSGAGGDGDEPNNESSTSEDGDDDEDDDMPSLVNERDDEDGGPFAFKVRYRTNDINIRRNGPLAFPGDEQHPVDEAEVEKEITEALHSYHYQVPTLGPYPDNSQFSYSKVQEGDTRNTVDCDTTQWKGLTIPDLEVTAIKYKDLTTAEDERRESNQLYVREHQKEYNPAHLESLVTDGLQGIFPGLVDHLSKELAPHCLIPVQSIPWHERPVDNAMLRNSLRVDASGAIPTCIGTYIEAYVDGYVHSSLILEPTKDILWWMDLNNDIKEHIRTQCPEYLRDQLLGVFFSCTPPVKKDRNTTWLRNSLLAHYPDNMYLVHLMDSKDVPGTFPPVLQ
jgi:hypothetical protein